MSLLEEHDHVVVDVETNVAVSFILHGETASQQAKTMPGLSVSIIELGLDVFGNVGVVA